MSIVNFHLAGDRALVCVDTWGGTPKRQQHVNKLWPVPHANMLVAGRGSGALLSRAAWLCGAMGDFDQVRCDLPKELRSALRRLRLAWGWLSPPLRGGQEVYVFGHSAERGEMMALSLTCGIRGPFEVVDDFDESCAPDCGTAPPAHWGHRTALQFARAQVAYARTNWPGQPIGGRLLMATLTKSTTWIECAGELDAATPLARETAHVA